MFSSWSCGCELRSGFLPLRFTSTVGIYGRIRRWESDSRAVSRTVRLLPVFSRFPGGSCPGWRYTSTLENIWPHRWAGGLCCSCHNLTPLLLHPKVRGALNTHSTLLPSEQQFVGRDTTAPGCLGGLMHAGFPRLAMHEYNGDPMAAPSFWTTLGVGLLGSTQDSVALARFFHHRCTGRCVA